MLTKQQSELFVKRYQERYGKSDSLPSISKDVEEDEIIIWKDFLRHLLGGDSDKLYKYRSRGKETKLEKLFNDLWLNYGPKII